MPAIGMTDHGNMFGASEFFHAATKVGIKPIIGVEAYVAPGSRFDTRRILWGDPAQKSDDVSGSGSYTHLTMVAETATTIEWGGDPEVLAAAVSVGLDAIRGR